MKEAVASLLVAAFLLFLPFMEAAVPSQSAPLGLSTRLNMPHVRQPWILVPRGGSDDDSDEYGSDEEVEEDIIIEDNEDDYDSEEEEEEDTVMVKSAVKAVEKAKGKQTETAKEAVNAKLLVKKSKKPSLVKRYVPYIVRACMTPATLIAMTKAYFASLFNLNYLAEVESMICCSFVADFAGFVWTLTLHANSGLVGFIARFAFCPGIEGEEVRLWWGTQGEENNETGTGQDTFGPASVEYVRLRRTDAH